MWRDGESEKEEDLCRECEREEMIGGQGADKCEWDFILFFSMHFKINRINLES